MPPSHTPPLIPENRTPAGKADEPIVRTVALYIAVCFAIVTGIVPLVFAYAWLNGNWAELWR